MKRIVQCLGLAFLVFIAGCSSISSESYVRTGYNFTTVSNVAVIDVVGAVQSETVKAQIADEFSKQLLQKGYAPVQRDYIMRLLNDNSFTSEGLSPEAYAIEVGRLLGYEAVLIVNLPSFGEEASITAKILEAQDGSALWIASGSTTIGLGNLNKIPDSPYGSALFEPTQQSLDSLTGGSALTAKQMKGISRLVERMCESLPDKSLPWMAMEPSAPRLPDEIPITAQPVVRPSRTHRQSDKIPILWDLWPGNWGKR